MNTLLHCVSISLAIIVVSALLSSCTSDKLPEPAPLVEVGFCDTIPATYVASIKEIIDNNCAYSGCHVSGNGVPGDYTSYAGLQTVIGSGEFELRVIIEKDDEEEGMPPFYVPEGKPEDLTQEQLDVISCWIEAGYPES